MYACEDYYIMTTAMIIQKLSEVSGR